MTPAKRHPKERIAAHQLDGDWACAAQGKVTYSTKARALQAIAAHRRYGHERWAYKCRDCKRWHLTSHPPRAQGAAS